MICGGFFCKYELLISSSYSNGLRNFFPKDIFSRRHISDDIFSNMGQKYTPGGGAGGSSPLTNFKGPGGDTYRGKGAAASC